MDRREAITGLGIIVSGSVVGAGVYLPGCKPKNRKSIFGLLDKQQMRIVDEFSETILPKSNSSPGAKEVKIAEYINTIITDCLDENHKKVIIDGIVQLQKLALEKFDEKFMELKEEEREELLIFLEEESKLYNKNRNKEDPAHYYTLMKNLAISGYLSSKQVGTSVFRYTPVPGRYEGCIPYKPGEKSFL